MEREQISRRVTAIHIDLDQRSVALDFEGADAPTVVVDGGDFVAAVSADAAPVPPQPSAVEAGATPENDTAVVLTGHLRALAKEGRPDRNGKPTAWAPFLGKAGDEEQPEAYSATFYRGAAPIALSLAKGAHLTVRGFVRPSGDPAKNDWLSVVGVLNYPGKAERPEPAPPEPSG